mgnify:CR=1 FL=1
MQEAHGSHRLPEKQIQIKKCIWFFTLNIELEKKKPFKNWKILNGKTLNPLHPKMLCAKFGWNWASGSGEEDFLKFVNIFSLFRYYLYLKRGMALHLRKFEASSTKTALCQVWLKLAQWFWRRRFLNFINVFLLFCNYLSLEKCMTHHLRKLEFFSPKDALCQVWLKLAQLLGRKRWKCEKFTDRWTTGNQKSSLELSAQVS